MPKQPSAIPTLEVSEYLSAAALRAAGIPYAGAALDGSRIVFRFEDQGGAATKALADHINGKLKVSSFDMASAVNFAKDQLFNARRAGGLQ